MAANDVTEDHLIEDHLDIDGENATHVLYSDGVRNGATSLSNDGSGNLSLRPEIFLSFLS